MGEVVNLRRARKRRERDAGRREGDAAAAKHGRTKAARKAEAAEAEREARRLEGHRREPARDAEGAEDDDAGA